MAATQGRALSLRRRVVCGTCLATLYLVTASDAANHAVGGETRADAMQIATVVKADSSDLHDGCSISLRQLEPANFKENVMGKYFLAWLLGVPGGILLLIFLFTHVF